MIGRARHGRRLQTRIAAREAELDRLDRQGGVLDREARQLRQQAGRHARHDLSDRDSLDRSRSPALLREHDLGIDL